MLMLSLRSMPEGLAATDRALARPSHPSTSTAVRRCWLRCEVPTVESEISYGWSRNRQPKGRVLVGGGAVGCKCYRPREPWVCFILVSDFSGGCNWCSSEHRGTTAM